MKRFSLRELIAWTAIVVVALAIIWVGLAKTDEGGTLRLALGPDGTVSHQLGLAVKRLVEDQTGYRVVLATGDNSTDRQHMLLNGQVDLAVLAPEALPAKAAWSAVAPLGSLYTQLMGNSGGQGLLDHDQLSINLGPAHSDSEVIGQRVLKALGVDPRNDTTAGIALLTDGLTGATVAQRLQQGAQKLHSISGAAAASLHLPLSRPAAIPAHIYSAGSFQAPDNNILGLATPVVLATQPDASGTMVRAVAKALQSPQAQATLVRFQPGVVAPLWPLLPANAALNDSDQSLRDLLRGQLVWLLDNKWLVLLVIVVLVLVDGQVRYIRNRREKQQRGEKLAELDHLIDQVIALERQARTLQNVQELTQIREELAHLKARGSRLLLGSPLINEPVAQVFYGLCHQAWAAVEGRLGEKSALYTAA